jgi:hypothetical protein
VPYDGESGNIQKNDFTIGEIYELVLLEWGLTPEYVNKHWTEELLHLMLRARLKRFERARPVMGEMGQAPRQAATTREEEFAATCFARYTEPTTIVQDGGVAAKLKELEKYQE